jgi:hypothetical protein
MGTLSTGLLSMLTSHICVVLQECCKSVIVILCYAVIGDVEHRLTVHVGISHLYGMFVTLCYVTLCNVMQYYAVLCSAV